MMKPLNKLFDESACSLHTPCCEHTFLLRPRNTLHKKYNALLYCCVVCIIVANPQQLKLKKLVLLA
jgi:hypothetical protein